MNSKIPGPCRTQTSPLSCLPHLRSSDVAPCSQSFQVWCQVPRSQITSPVPGPLFDHLSSPPLRKAARLCLGSSSRSLLSESASRQKARRVQGSLHSFPFSQESQLCAAYCPRPEKATLCTLSSLLVASSGRLSPVPVTTLWLEVEVPTAL